jgi:hypothetical protein
MKIIIACLLVIFCCLGVYSQTTPRTRVVRGSNSQIVVSDSARFEIVRFNQFSVTARLDRYTGKTSVYTVSGRRRWTPLEVSGGLPNEAASTTPKYQIYDDAENIFLMNNETGQSWIFYNNLSWIPVAD